MILVQHITNSTGSEKYINYTVHSGYGSLVFMLSGGGYISYFWVNRPGESDSEEGYRNVVGSIISSISHSKVSDYTYTIKIRIDIAESGDHIQSTNIIPLMNGVNSMSFTLSTS